MSSLKYQRIGSAADEEHLGNQFWRGCAGFLCDHTESKGRPCRNCLLLIEPLLKPIIRFIRDAALGNRADTVIGKADGYASMGAALDNFLMDVNYVVGLSQDPATAARAVEEAHGADDPAPGVYGNDPRDGPGGSAPDHAAPEQVLGGDLPGSPGSIEAVPQADGASS